MKFFITILLLFPCTISFAQIDSGIYAKSSTYMRLQEEINPALMEGSWRNIDSSAGILVFKREPHELELMGHDAFSGYGFLRRSDTTVSKVGVLMRWPPSYCYILFVNENELHLEFSGVANQNAVVRKYKKVKTEE